MCSDCKASQKREERFYNRNEAVKNIVTDLGQPGDTQAGEWEGRVVLHWTAGLVRRAG